MREWSDQLIQNKKDYLDFRKADRISMGVSNRKISRFANSVYIFEVRLRKLEFAINCSNNPVRKTFRRFLYRRSSIQLGYSISPNTFGPGLSIAHRGTIVVNGGSRIGANCRIHAGVNIGTAAGKESSAPRIGDNCYIGPGAKIFGPITIGPGSVIGANAVVNKSFTAGNQTIAGVPAAVISNKSSKGLLILGYKEK
jgi:serine O-acetyltransferase